MSNYNGFNSRSQELVYSKALYNTVFLLQLRIYKLFKGEKFDDIKFGKVLTKLYARLYSLEQQKFLPPKYSFALKDLAVFLGIFEVSEEDLKQQRQNLSETSSNLSNLSNVSYMTQSAFKPHKGRKGLDIINENEEVRDDEDEDSQEEVPLNKANVGENARTGSKRYVGAQKQGEPNSSQNESVLTEAALNDSTTVVAVSQKKTAKQLTSKQIGTVRSAATSVETSGNRARRTTASRQIGLVSGGKEEKMIIANGKRQTGIPVQLVGANSKASDSNNLTLVYSAKAQSQNRASLHQSKQRSMVRRLRPSEERRANNQNNSDSDHSVASRFSNDSRRLKRNNTNNSRGSAGCTASVKSKGFSRKALPQRPKIPAPIAVNSAVKTAALTAENLRKQQEEAENQMRNTHNSSFSQGTDSAMNSFIGGHSKQQLQPQGISGSGTTKHKNFQRPNESRSSKRSSNTAVELGSLKGRQQKMAYEEPQFASSSHIQDAVNQSVNLGNHPQLANASSEMASSAFSDVNASSLLASDIGVPRNKGPLPEFDLLKDNIQLAKDSIKNPYVSTQMDSSEVGSGTNDVTLSPSILLAGPRNQKTLSMSKTNELGCSNIQTNKPPTSTGFRSSGKHPSNTNNNNNINPLRLSLSQGKQQSGSGLQQASCSMTEKKRPAADNEPKFKIAHLQQHDSVKRRVHQSNKAKMMSEQHQQFHFNGRRSGEGIHPELNNQTMLNQSNQSNQNQQDQVHFTADNVGHFVSKRGSQHSRQIQNLNQSVDTCQSSDLMMDQVVLQAAENNFVDSTTFYHSNLQISNQSKQPSNSSKKQGQNQASTRMQQNASISASNDYQIGAVGQRAKPIKSNRNNMEHLLEQKAQASAGTPLAQEYLEASAVVSSHTAKNASSVQNNQSKQKQRRMQTGELIMRQQKASGPPLNQKIHNRDRHAPPVTLNHHPLNQKFVNKQPSAGGGSSQNTSAYSATTGGFKASLV